MLSLLFVFCFWLTTMSKEQNSYLLLSTPCFTSLGKRKGRRSSGYEVGALKKKILKSVPQVLNLVPNTFPIEKRKSSGDEVVKYLFLITIIIFGTCLLLQARYICMIQEIPALFYIPRCRTNFRKFSIRFQGPKFFNSLSREIQNSESISLFGERIQRSLLS